jgi:hypothetical protein
VANQVLVACAAIRQLCAQRLAPNNDRTWVYDDRLAWSQYLVCVVPPTPVRQCEYHSHGGCVLVPAPTLAERCEWACATTDMSGSALGLKCNRQQDTTCDSG